jgi:CheY-like chemotaxis protein
MEKAKRQKYLTVLIVEDDLIQTLLLKKIITELGFNVVDCVTSAEGAIKKTIQHQPDIITMDIILDGEMDGISAVENIQKQYEVPVIYITSNSDKYTFERAQKTAFVDYLSKPVSMESLSDSLTLVTSKVEKHKKTG